MIKRYDINVLNKTIRKQIKIAILSFVLFVILLVVSAICDIILLGIVSVLFFLFSGIMLLIATKISMNKEQEEHYLFVESIILEYIELEEEQLALIFKTYLSDIPTKLIEFGINAYVCLNINEEELEVDIYKDDNLYRFTFNKYDVYFEVLDKNDVNLFSKEENFQFKIESDILNYIIDNIKNF